MRHRNPSALLVVCWMLAAAVAVPGAGGETDGYRLAREFMAEN